MSVLSSGMQVSDKGKEVIQFQEVNSNSLNVSSRNILDILNVGDEVFSFLSYSELSRLKCVSKALTSVSDLKVALGLKSNLNKLLSCLKKFSNEKLSVESKLAVIQEKLNKKNEAGDIDLSYLKSNISSLINEYNELEKLTFLTNFSSINTNEGMSEKLLIICALYHSFGENKKAKDILKTAFPSADIPFKASYKKDVYEKIILGDVNSFDILFDINVKLIVGDDIEAMQLVHEIEDNELKIEGYNKIVEYYFNEGKEAEAIKLIKEVGSHEIFDELLKQKYNECPKSNEIELLWAKEITTVIKNPLTRDRFFVYLSYEYNSLGNHHQALHCANQIENKLDYISTIADLIMLYIDEKKNFFTTMVLDQINDQKLRLEVLILCEARYLDKNKFERSLEVILLMNETKAKDKAYLAVVRRYRNQGELEKSLKVNKLIIDNTEAKDTNYNSVSRDYYDQGELEKSLKANKLIFDEDNRDMGFGKLIVGYAKLGKTEKALEILREVKDKDLRTIWKEKINKLASNVEKKE